MIRARENTSCAFISVSLTLYVLLCYTEIKYRQYYERDNMSGIIAFINHKLSHFNIISKLMLIYIFGGLIPLVLVGVLLSSNTRNILIDRAIEEAKTNTDRIEERLLEVFMVATEVSDSLYLDSELQSVISRNYETELEAIRAQNSFNRIDDYLQLYTEIASIRIYAENQTLLDDSQIIRISDSDRKTSWYQRAILGKGKTALIYRYDSYSRQEYLAMVRQLRNSKREVIGTIIINISQDYLNNIIESEPYDIYIVYSDSDVVVAKDTSMQIMDVFGEPLVNHFTEQPYGTSTMRHNDINYRTFVDEIDIGTEQKVLKLITAMPVNDLTEAAAMSTRSSVALMLISMSLSLFMVYILSKAFSERVNSFRKDMHLVAEGDFSVQSTLSGGDEVGQLSDDLNVMVQSIQSIINDAYVTRLQKEQLALKQNEAQFKMLASQINPHFLYNALETIRMKAHTNGQKEIADIVKKLAKIMRRNLSIKNTEVSLASEIDLVSSYLEIQQFRFGDRISYNIEIDCDAKQYDILPLLLQPLVENAFIHGLERKVGTGSIDIRIQEVDEGVKITVSDNGLGMSEGVLSNIKGKLKNDDLSIDGSIGLTNVNQRMKLFYGDGCGIEIDSKEGSGTKVSILLPYNIGRT